MYGYPRPAHSFAWSLAVTAISFTVVFLFFYVANLFSAGGIIKSANKTLICERCQTVQAKAVPMKCECGGLLEPFENWTWDTNV